MEFSPRETFELPGTTSFRLNTTLSYTSNHGEPHCYVYDSVSSPAATLPRAMRTSLQPRKKEKQKAA
jgi:hypothetical protein